MGDSRNARAATAAASGIDRSRAPSRTSAANSVEKPSGPLNVSVSASVGRVFKAEKWSFWKTSRASDCAKSTRRTVRGCTHPSPERSRAICPARRLRQATGGRYRISGRLVCVTQRYCSTVGLGLVIEASPSVRLSGTGMPAGVRS